MLFARIDRFALAALAACMRSTEDCLLSVFPARP
jgi:hypothetical protein